MVKKSNIENHSEVMSLLGKKLGLMENINHLNSEIQKIDKELQLCGVLSRWSPWSEPTAETVQAIHGAEWTEVYDHNGNRGA